MRVVSRPVAVVLAHDFAGFISDVLHGAASPDVPPRKTSVSTFNIRYTLPPIEIECLSQSWVAFNQWPAAQMPSFSKRIPLHPSAYTHNCWSVTLLKIEFQWYDERRDMHHNLYDNEYGEGLEVLVDSGLSPPFTANINTTLNPSFTSGSSTSELPYRTINGIHTDVFANADPLPETDFRRQTYHVPPDFPVHQYRVRLVFKGGRGRENVVLYVPFEHFVCERDLRKWPNRIEDCPYQGVIFAAQSSMPFGVLGLVSRVYPSHLMCAAIPTHD